MSDLLDLYQEMILDHHKRPRNRGALTGAARSAEGYNPLCGDRVKIFVEVAGDRVERISFEGTGCAISTASASLMTEAVKGRPLQEVERLFESFHRLLTVEPAPGEQPDSTLGKLAVFSGVREFPVRVKCATLAWHTLQAALGDGGEPVSTE